MSQVNVLIYGVILYCDDSILDIELGNGYVLEKRYLDELPFKDKITDGEGKLTINYMGSQLSDEKGKYFICIRKEDTYSVEMPEIKPGMVLTDSDFMCEDQINEYKKNQMQYLHKVFSLLHLFKAGNIGFIQLFFEQKYTAMGFITNTKPTDPDYDALVVFNSVFGAGAHSKLFNNVREKLSLAYYAASQLERFKGMIVVNAGIEFENFQKAYDETLVQLEEIRKGNISEHEFTSSKIAIINNYKSFYDDQRAMASTNMMNRVAGNERTVEEMTAAIERVTVEDVVAVSKKLQLDTSYFLKGKEAE